MDGNYKRLSINTILVFVGKAGSSLIGLLMLPLYTNWLSPDEYGTVDLISVYSNIVISIITCCVADAIFVVPNRKSDRDLKSFFTTGVVFLIGVSILIFILPIVFSFIFGKNIFFVSNSKFIILLSLAMMWLNYMQQFCRTINRMIIFSITGIIHTILIATLSLLLIPKFGLDGYLCALICSYFCCALFSFIGAKLYSYIKIYLFNYSVLIILLKYSIPLVPNSIMWWLVNGFNRPFMESKLGLFAIGIYAVAMKFPSLITSLCDVFMNAFSISMIEEYGKESFKQFFNNIFRIAMIGVIFLSMIVTIFSIPIVKIFAADEFFEAWRILPILTISSVFSCASSLMGGVFIAKKESKYFFYSSIWGGGTSVILTIAFIEIWGVIGCAIAVCASFAVMFLVRLFYAWNDIDNLNIGYYIAHLIILISVVAITIVNVNMYVRLFGYVFMFGYVLSRNIDLIKFCVKKSPCWK